MPITFGNLDKWPGIHEFEAIAGQHGRQGRVRNLVFGPGGASFTTPR